VYEPSGWTTAREAIVDHSSSSQAKPWVVRSAGESSGSKHERVSRWQVGPAGWTVTSSASPSQSSEASRTCRTLPEVSPLRQSRPREREWKWTSPVARVAASASGSM
jgi:hypothetical protein